MSRYLSLVAGLAIALMAAAALAQSAPPMPREKPKPPARTQAPASALCSGLLDGLAIEARAMAPIREGACGAETVISVRAAGVNRAIKLSPSATINCPVARSLAKWLSTAVDPAAVELLGSRVASIRVAASYACRTRNHIRGARLSEHAKANAIDISAFVLADGRRIDVRPYRRGLRLWPASRKVRFLARVRKAACGPFRTVLGPGADAFHDDHFHLDMAKRRQGSAPICR